MIDPLLGIRNKIKRAHNQLMAAQSEIDVFFAKRPYELVVERSPDGLEVYAVVKERHPVDLMLSVIAGEIVHDMRSALDHLVWELVIKETGAPPTTNKTQFPIFITREGYDSKRGERSLLHGVGTRAKAIIRSLQPFETGEDRDSPL